MAYSYHSITNSSPMNYILTIPYDQPTEHTNSYLPYCFFPPLQENTNYSRCAFPAPAHNPYQQTYPPLNPLFRKYLADQYLRSAQTREAALERQRRDVQERRLELEGAYKYVKKNAESNVINQIFSYLSIRSKSQGIVTRILKGNASKINLYYDIMKQIKKQNKKYINRCYLKSLLEMDDEHIAHSIAHKLDPKAVLPIDELRKVLRVLLLHYMRGVCINTVLTSSKLDRITKNQHLERRREVLSYLLFHIRAAKKQ